MFIGKTFMLDESSIDLSDWIRMILFYFIMIAVRYAMVIIVLPLLNSTGYPVSWKDCIILTYGGLRGAIALA